MSLCCQHTLSGAAGKSAPNGACLLIRPSSPYIRDVSLQTVTLSPSYLYANDLLNL